MLPKILKKNLQAGKYKTNIFRAKIDGAILAVINEVRVQTLPPAGVTFFHDRNETLIPTFFPFWTSLTSTNLHFFSLSKFASQPIESFQLRCTIQFSIIRFQFLRQKFQYTIAFCAISKASIWWNWSQGCILNRHQLHFH